MTKYRGLQFLNNTQHAKRNKNKKKLTALYTQNKLTEVALKQYSLNFYVTTTRAETTFSVVLVVEVLDLT